MPEVRLGATGSKADETNQVRWLCLTFAIGVASCHGATDASPGSRSEIEARFADRIVRFDQLDRDVQEYIREADVPSSVGLIELDFDGVGERDIGFLVRDHDSRVWVRLYTCNEKFTCEQIYQLNLGSDLGTDFLSVLSRGEIVKPSEAIESESALSTIVLEHDALVINYFGAAQVAVIWDAKTRKPIEVTTSD